MLIRVCARAYIHAHTQRNYHDLPNSPTSFWIRLWFMYIMDRVPHIEFEPPN